MTAGPNALAVFMLADESVSRIPEVPTGRTTSENHGLQPCLSRYTAGSPELTQRWHTKRVSPMETGAR
jgi:hypothetical protein